MYVRLLNVTFPSAAFDASFSGVAGSSARARMDRERRAKLFAPFDALEGFSDSIRDRNSALVEELERLDSP